MIESAPAETPVICQVNVFVPAKSVPMLIVGVATEKRPFADFSVTETLDRLVYRAALTWFSMLTVTVLVSPTSKVAGIEFAGSPSIMSKYWLYELWHGLHGFVDFENAGEARAAITMAMATASASNILVLV